MRILEADVGYSYHIHRAYTEWARDTQNLELPIEVWLTRFSDPTFFCHLAFHGKQVVGMFWGAKKPFGIEIEGLFVKRRFRGNLRFLRRMLVALRGIVPKDGKIRSIVTTPCEPFLKRKGFKPAGLVMERGV